MERGITHSRHQKGRRYFLLIGDAEAFNGKRVLYILCLILALVLSLIAKGGQDPAELSVKFYRLYVSAYDTCEGAKLLFGEPNPDYRSILHEPTFASVDNSDRFLDGTYQCVILQISDVLYFAPRFNEGGCLRDERYATELCETGESTRDPDGNLISCGSNIEDKIYVYVSTLSTESRADGRAFEPPTESDQALGLNMESSFRILGSQIGTLVINAKEQVRNVAGECLMGAPTLTFR